MLANTDFSDRFTTIKVRKNTSTSDCSFGRVFVLYADKAAITGVLAFSYFTALAFPAFGPTRGDGFWQTLRAADFSFAHAFLENVGVNAVFNCLLPLCARRLVCL